MHHLSCGALVRTPKTNLRGVRSSPGPPPFIDLQSRWAHPIRLTRERVGGCSGTIRRLQRNNLLAATRGAAPYHQFHRQGYCLITLVVSQFPKLRHYHHLPVIDIAAECALHRLQIGAVTVRADPHPVGDAVADIVHQLDGGLAGTVDYKIGNDKSAVGINAGPSPNIVRVGWRGLAEATERCLQ